jgi:cell division protein FtsB
MFQESAPRLLNVHRGLILTLSLSAAAGWSSFAIVRHTSVAVKHQLQDQVASLQATQTQLVAEQMKARVSLSEMAQLRADFAAAQREINRLFQSREQARVEYPPVRPDAKGANLQPNDATRDVSRTESIGEKTSAIPKDNTVSTKLPEKQARNPQVAAIGISPPGIQKPAVKPRGKELTVVSEPDTAALRQLVESTETPGR